MHVCKSARNSGFCVVSLTHKFNREPTGCAETDERIDTSGGGKALNERVKANVVCCELAYDSERVLHGNPFFDFNLCSRPAPLAEPPLHSNRSGARQTAEGFGFGQAAGGLWGSLISMGVAGDGRWSVSAERHGAPRPEAEVV